MAQRLIPRRGPADKIERWPIERLEPWARNSRLHSDADLGALTRSIQRWGITMPPLVDEKGRIIAGHLRVLAAAKAGLKTMPVIVVRGWSEADKRAYCIADNQLAARAKWDFDVLKEEIKFLESIDYPVTSLGFELADLSAIFAPALSQFQTDPDAAPPITMEMHEHTLSLQAVHMITLHELTN